MPDEVAGDDTCADPADPHDQDDAAPDSSPNWNVSQALVWIIWRQPPSAELLKMLQTVSDEDNAPPAVKALAKKVATALDVLNYAAMAGRLPVCARRSFKLGPPPSPPPRECVPANVIDEVRRIGADGCIDIQNPNFDEVLHPHGPHFYDVVFRAADVKKLKTSPVHSNALVALRGYDASDKPLLDDMERLLATGEASGDWQAALMVAPRAKGSTHGDSKVKRLLGKFQKRRVLRSSEQS
jgi:hypothetical protein